MAATFRLIRAATLAVSFAAVSSYGSLPAAELPRRAPSPGAIPLTEPVELSPEIAGFYRDRGFQPLWIAGSHLRPEAAILLALVPSEGGLSAAVRQAADGEPHRLARADLLLSKAYVDQIAGIQDPPATNGMTYVDPQLAPRRRSPRQLLEALASAPNRSSFLRSSVIRNPAFDGLKRGLALYRSHWSRLPQNTITATGDLPALSRRLGLAKTSQTAVAERLRAFQAVHGLPQTARADAVTVAALNRGAAYYEKLIETNIERARAIPPLPAGRYILVDTGSAQLWLIEDGRIRDTMRVIVGKANMQTPAMAGLMSHVVLNPYWNLPPDLIRQRARHAARRGAEAISSEHLQVLSDWSDHAVVLDPGRVNWAAVASGQQHVNLRQQPGPHNMMGAIKFMFPNDLGIYLHDTPFRTHFTRPDRRLSSGCVRVEDAARLARWIFNGSPPRSAGGPEEEVVLPEPLPVYITYLTVLPMRSGVVFQPDSYRRDRATTGSTRSRVAPARS